jgi:hypothetical protein
MESVLATISYNGNGLSTDCDGQLGWATANCFLPRISRKRAGEQPQKQNFGGTATAKQLQFPQSLVVAVVLPARFCEIRGKAVRLQLLIRSDHHNPWKAVSRY